MELIYIQHAFRITLLLNNRSRQLYIPVAIIWFCGTFHLTDLFSDLIKSLTISHHHQLSLAQETQRLIPFTRTSQGALLCPRRTILVFISSGTDPAFTLRARGHKGDLHDWGSDGQF